MGVEIVEVQSGYGRQRWTYGALMCNTSMKLLPLTFESQEQARAFLDYCEDDPRRYSPTELEDKYQEFLDDT